jgi:hypothetical protein
MIIGINGKIGSGKDTVGKIIQYLTYPVNVDIQTYLEKEVNGQFEIKPNVHTVPNFEIKKFAGKLKLIGSILSGVPVEMFEDQEFKKLDVSPEWWKKDINWGIEKLHGEHVMKDIPMTYREFLQKLGTEAMRDGLHINVWVNALFADYKCIGGKMIPVPKEDEYNPKYREYPNWIITDMRFPNEMDAVEQRKGITIKVVRPGTVTGEHPSETALDNAKFDYIIENNGSLEDLVEKVREILIKESII